MHARFFVLPVLRLPLTGLIVLQKLRPGVFGFVDEDDIDLVAQLLRTERGQGAAGDNELAPPPEFRRQFEDSALVNDVPGEADDVGVDVKIDGLDVLIHQHDFVFPGREARHRRQ